MYYVRRRERLDGSNIPAISKITMSLRGLFKRACCMALQKFIDGDGIPSFHFLECGVDDTSWIADTITSTLTI